MDTEAVTVVERDPDVVSDIVIVANLDGGPDSVVVIDTDADTLTDTVTVPLRDVAPEGVSVVVVV